MRTTNVRLEAALAAAAWSPRDLVRALNPRLDAVGEPRLHPTAAHGWLNGACPRSATVRRLVVALLGEATGTAVTVHSLWPHLPATPPHQEERAVDGLVGPLPLSDVLVTATAWNSSSSQDKATLRPATGAALFTASWDAASLAPRPLRPQSGSDRVLPPLMDMIEAHLSDLRRLDDSAGGGALSQLYVHGALASVLDLLRKAEYTPTIGTRLLRAASQLAQLSGWMAFDADLHAAAQRYQLIGLRLARAADATNRDGIIANILGMLAYQHAATGHPYDALRFAQAAVDHTKGAAATVRARALGRLATAHAAAGDLDAFRQAAERCRTLLAHRRPEDDPPHLYYFTDTQLDAEAGQALVDLAGAHPQRARQLLREAIVLLTPLAVTGPASGFRRSALLHSIHLVRAHLAARAPDETLTALTDAAAKVPTVQSIRCRIILQDLRSRAAERIRSATAADAFQAVDRALSGT